MAKKLTETIIAKAEELFDQVEVMAGYSKGSNPLKVSPCFIEKKQDLDQLIFDKLCINNLATYAYRLSKQVKGNIGMVLKPCDAKAVNQLISEELIDRAACKMLVVGCAGVLDHQKISRHLGGARVFSANIGPETIEVETAEGKKELKTADFYADKCHWCSISDQDMGGDVFVENQQKLQAPKKDRFEDVKQLEKLDLDQIEAYWKDEFSRCIRCYACRNVCPLEVCQDQCIVHLDFPNWQSQKVVPSENKFFQLIRVMHLAGRCVECGECQRVCPQNIGLLKMMKKMNQQIETLFNFTPGMDVEAKPPLLTYKTVEENIEEEELI